jgi:hypothetical protein
MKRSRHQDIRNALSVSEDGLTLLELAVKLDSNYKAIQKAIKNVWGVYIDRWAVPKRGQFAAVYMCADVPSNAPHPTERYLPKTMWQPTKQEELQ